MRGVLLLGMLAVPAIAAAADWRMLSIDDRSGGVLYYDASSVKSVSGVKLGWTQIVNADWAKSNGIKSAKVRYAVHCGSNTLQSMSWVTFDRSGNVRGSNNRPDAPSDVVPESFGEAIYEQFCHGKGNGSKRVEDPIATTDVYFSGTGGAN